MEDYRANSHKAKAEAAAATTQQPPEKKNEKVAKGSVAIKKKSPVAKFAETFIQEDAKTMKGYLLDEVVIPAVKTTISDVVRNMLDMMFWGKSGRPRTGYTNASRVQYTSYSRQQTVQARQLQTQPQTQSRTKVYDFDDIIFNDRQDAIDVRDKMREQLGVYLMVSVADLKDFAGVEPKYMKYTDNKYGWTDLSMAEVVHVAGGGWRIDLPKAIVLE